MERTPEIFEKIEQYLANTLTQEERSAFEKELAINPELHEEVEMHRLMHDTLKDQDTLDFKKKLIHISAKIQEEEEEKRQSKNPYSFYLKVAALTIILFGIGIVWKILVPRNQMQNLYEAYYEPFPIEDIVRGNADHEIKGIIENYTKGSYKAVAVSLEKYPDIKNQTQLQLYLGNSYLNSNQDEKAVSLFQTFKNDGKYYEASKWYLSLAYLKINEPKKAIPLLKEIIDYNGVYKEKALRLYKDLEK